MEIIKSNFQLAGRSYKNSDYTFVIAVMNRPETYNNCAETHLGGGVMSTYVFPFVPLPALTHALTMILQWRLTCHLVSPDCTFWYCCKRYESVLGMMPLSA